MSNIFRSRNDSHKTHSIKARSQNDRDEMKVPNSMYIDEDTNISNGVLDYSSKQNLFNCLNLMNTTKSIVQPQPPPKVKVTNLNE